MNNTAKAIFAAAPLGLAASPLAAQSQSAPQPAPAPAPAPGAEAAASIAEGTVVYGSDGEQIGTVAGGRGEMVYLKVGERPVPIARKAISAGANGPTIPITRAKLIAQYDQQIAAYKAKLDAAITTGAEVRTADDHSLGQIETVADEAVKVNGSDGPVTLPRTALALDRAGNVRVRATMEQIKQARSEVAGTR